MAAKFKKKFRLFIKWLLKAVKLTLTIILIFAAASAVVLAIPRLITHFYARPRIFPLDSVTTHRVAIVFGAGLNRDGGPSAVLQDRVATAADLYFAGKVEKILMSGDNRFAYYNEPGAMQQYALDLGVPSEDIVLDYAGRRTYDTCYRARAIFGLSSAILVTQNFHLPRAIYTCNQLGLPSIGVSADKRTYHPRASDYWVLREIPATLVAFWEVFITHPLPVLGDPEPIFPSNN